MPANARISISVGVACWLMGATGFAQGSATAYVQLGNGVLCGTTNAVSGAASAICSSGNGVTQITHGVANASAANGRLHSETASQLLEPNGATLGLAVNSSSNWSDALTFTGLRPASIRFTANVSGSNGYTLLSQNTDILLTGSFSISATAIPQGTLSSGGSILPAMSAHGNGSTPQGVFVQGVNQTFAVDIPVFGTTSRIDLFMQLGLRSSIRGSGLGGLTDGASLQDFSHTAELVDLQAFDANGNDISNQVDFDWANGTIVGATTVAPEASSFLLCLVGLSGIFGVRQARRKIKVSAT